MTTAPSLPQRTLATVLATAQRHGLVVGSIFLGVMTLSALLANVKPPDYAATGRLRFTRNSPTASITEAGRQVGQLEALVEQSSPLETEIEVLQSSKLIEPVIQKLGLKDDQGAQLTNEDFLQNLRVKAVRSSDVLAITYVGQEPQQVAAVVNELLQSYLVSDVAARRAQARKALDFVEQQLPASQRRVAAAEQALTQFQQSSDQVLASQDPSGVVTRASALKQQVGELTAALADTEAQLGVLRSQFEASQADPRVRQTMLSQSGPVQSALSELSTAELELGQLKARYQLEAPIVREAQANVDALREIVRQRQAEALEGPTAGVVLLGTPDPLYQSLTREILSLESRQSGLVQQLEVLTGQEALAQEQLRLLPQHLETQRTLQQTVEVAQAANANLLEKVGELRIAEAQNVGNAEVLVAAEVPLNPVSSKVPLYAAGLLLSVMLSGLWIYTAESQQREIHLQNANSSSL
ncbi:MAG: hypothetical protein HC824_00690 [Synechococcales cyanobacterium RM1_1_8]|nr:hypothetical protein [Synechococcales cyanobacterium RM1_1_8]